MTFLRSIIFRHQIRSQLAPDNFFWWLLLIWDSKNHTSDHSEQRSHEINSLEAINGAKFWTKSRHRYSTSIGFPLKIRKLVKFINFSFFNRNPMEVVYFGRVLYHFLPMPPTLGELISKLEWFFWSSFFCASMSLPTANRKKCLGDVAMVYNLENIISKISFQIFPRAQPHLPGERELLWRISYDFQTLRW